MKVIDIVFEHKFYYPDFINFLEENKLEYEVGSFDYSIDDELVEEYINLFKKSSYYKPLVDAQKNQEAMPLQQNNPSISAAGIPGLEYLDIVMQIQSIRRMGIISIFCALLNPIIGLISAGIGKSRARRLSVPAELQTSMYDAKRYNETGFGLSIFFIVVDILIAIISIAVAS